MKFNKDKNGFTFAFSIIMVVIVGVALSALSLGLTPQKQANVEAKKKINILSAMGIDANRSNVAKIYDEHIKNSYVVNSSGDLVENLPAEKQAFNLDVLKQMRDKTISVEDRLYPVFEAVNEEGENVYVLPMAGKGLWGPIWGFISISDDRETISGVSFDHQGETPGLGAEIAQHFFQKQWVGEKISTEGSPIYINVVKDGSGKEPERVDGITGGTVTSKGVERMVNETMNVYIKYFNKIK
ncbi:MAG: NADH:ubiquinone reductase (Na(+)-transporting) subunit C [Brumimicrobium sp.]|nr:NADH:ubiquinone reductase (Na(+)-transporting) subunit C [Brumimicrobium sp.]MCO5268146.1 NADH:ubiquinone reductase (Na(+)-transporting) subunit C [Brumimicrobium sp.]